MTDRPFEQGAPAYLRAGWQGVLPIKGKHQPPTGYTGVEGAWPSAADVLAWATGDEGRHNVGLRLPVNVIGIDVDHYGDKRGADTLGDAEAVWGELPATWRSTSRGVDNPSGIRFFVVPPGLHWPGQLGDAVEIIQYRHRYAVVWPSMHPEGRQYKWWKLEAADLPTTEVPHVDDLPALPDSWIQGLTRGETEQDIVKVNLDDATAALWLEASGKGTPCAEVNRALQRALVEIAVTGSRHDAAMRATSRLALMAAEGHPGIMAALGAVEARFTDVTAGEVRPGEWARLLSGAVRMAAARKVQPLDPCDLFATRPAMQATPQAASPGVTRVGQVAPHPPAALDQSSPSAAGAPFGDVPGGGPHGPEVAQDEPAAPVAPVASPLADALALELAQQRLRRDARRVLDAEDAIRDWREPDYTGTLTAELLLPDDPVTFRVAEVLPTEGNVLLTAQFKAGKTTLVINLAKSHADQLPFLGHLEVTPLGGRRIALWNYEVSRTQFRRWMRDADVENTDAIAVLNLRGFRLPLTAPAVEDWCVRWLVEHEIAVWVVDPFARAFGGANENDNSEVGRWLDTLDVIKDRAGVSELVLPTHTGRAVFEEGDERARGATRLDDWTDVRWLLTKDDEGQRYFRATGRDVEYDERLLHFDESTRRLSINGGSRKEVRAASVVDRVFVHVANNPKCSGSDIEAGVTGKAADIRKAIKDLRESRRITVEPGHRGAHLHSVVIQHAFGDLS